MKQWQIQQAKQQLSEVIRLTQSEGPQMITNRGEPAVWMISDSDYRKLIEQRESIVDFFQRSPHRDVDFVVERRQDKPRLIDL